MTANGEGTVVLRREFSKTGSGSWKHGSDDVGDTTPTAETKPNTRFLFGSGGLLATLSERDGAVNHSSGGVRGPTQLEASRVAGQAALTARAAAAWWCSRATRW